MLVLRLNFRILEHTGGEGYFPKDLGKFAQERFLMLTSTQR